MCSCKWYSFLIIYIKSNIEAAIGFWLKRWKQHSSLLKQHLSTQRLPIKIWRQSVIFTRALLITKVSGCEWAKKAKTINNTSERLRFGQTYRLFNNSALLGQIADSTFFLATRLCSAFSLTEHIICKEPKSYLWPNNYSYRTYPLKSQIEMLPKLAGWNRYCTEYCAIWNHWLQWHEQRQHNCDRFASWIATEAHLSPIDNHWFSMSGLRWSVFGDHEYRTCIGQMRIKTSIHPSTRFVLRPMQAMKWEIFRQFKPSPLQHPRSAHGWFSVGCRFATAKNPHEPYLPQHFQFFPSVQLFFTSSSYLRNIWSFPSLPNNTLCGVNERSNVHMHISIISHLEMNDLLGGSKWNCRWIQVI